MNGSGVALVRGEAVLRVLEVEFAAEGVAVDFGDDGGGGDGEAECVAVDELGLGAGRVDDHGVDEEVVGCDAELLDGGEHGHAGGLIDIDAVDGGGVDFCDGVGDGDAADFDVEFFAVFAGELFGVGEAHAAEEGGVLRQDDCGGDYGAEEGATTDFVDAGDGFEAVVTEGLLGGVGADELLEHLLLGGRFADAGRNRDAEGRGHAYWLSLEQSC